MGRTIRRFETQQPVWAVTDAWARENGYQVLQDGGSWRLYRRGTGLAVSAMFLQLQCVGEEVRLEAWIRADPFQRLVLLFQIPEEIELDPKSPLMIVPRRIARKAVNVPLQRFGQPPIS